MAVDLSVSTGLSGGSSGGVLAAKTSSQSTSMSSLAATIFGSSQEAEDYSDKNNEQTTVNAIDMFKKPNDDWLSVGFNNFLWISGKGAMLESEQSVINDFVYNLTSKYTSLSGPMGGTDVSAVTGSIPFAGVADGLTKVMLAYFAAKATGKPFDLGDATVVFGKGFSKTAASKAFGNYLKDNLLITNTFSDFAKAMGKQFESKTFTKILKHAQNASNEAKKSLMKSVNKRFGSALAKQFLNGFVSSVGVEYFASSVSNIIGTWFETGDFGIAVTKELEQTGQTLLRSTVKMTFATSFEYIGTVLKCPKAGKIVGTVIGDRMGEFAVNMFRDENGNVSDLACGSAAVVGGTCAAIGGAMAVSAVTGAVAVGSITALAGACIVAGAAIAALAVGIVVVWGIYKLVT